MDPFIRNYEAAELRIAAEFLSNWLPFLSRGLCESCSNILSDRIQNLGTGGNSAASSIAANQNKEDEVNCIIHSSISRNGTAANDGTEDTYSLGSWKDDADGLSEHAAEESSISEAFSSSAPLRSPRVKKSWADIAQEEENEVSSKSVIPNYSSGVETSVNDDSRKIPLTRDQREYIRFNNVKRQKDFICLERVNGKLVNILDGLELHSGVFSAVEQERIVKVVEQFQEMGRNGQLRERTYSAPEKWMRGKGRITLQFGCCYNYARDKSGNPPGILRTENVDPLPQLFKVMIKRLVRWHVLLPTCVPDSCIVNIYEEGDCIPPHIDNHDFLRPFCTVSFLSECKIFFGSNLKVVGAGEFDGSYSLLLPVGSVLVINGNGADVAKHCVPAVPTKRISITFRKMDESKWPLGHVPEPDLQGLQPLSDEVAISKKYNASRFSRSRKQAVGKEETISRESRLAIGKEEKKVRGSGLIAGHRDTQNSGRTRQGPVNRRRWMNLEK